MKTGTEALSERLLSEPLPESLIIPRGTDWPQSRSDIAKHPELKLMGTRRGAMIERRLEDIVAEARTRDVPEVTILFIAEALRATKFPDYILSRFAALADSVDVVYFARQQSSALPSVLAHRIQSWKSPHHTDLTIGALMREGRRRFKYDQYFDRWSGSGVRLIPLPYFEDDLKTDGLMQRFAQNTGISFPAAQNKTPTNASLGKEQLERLAALKRQLAWTRTIPVIRNLAERVYYAMRKRIRSETQGKKWVLTAAEKRQVTDFYRESNARFKKLLGSAARNKQWTRWFNEVDPPRR
jgi:hypothetical protein